MIIAVNHIKLAFLVMQGSVEILCFEEGRLDTGNICYRAILGRMGPAACPSFFCALEIFGWCKSAV